jgi:hypothetical protein
MKKLIIKLEPYFKVQFFVPTALNQYLSILSQTFFYIFLFLLPIIAFLSTKESYSENILLKLIATFTTITISLYIIKIIIFGKDFKVDPPGFVPVLIFALFVVFSGFLSTLLQEESNFTTFGNDEIRSFSSIFVMMMVGLFFVVNVNIRDLSSIKKAVFLLTTSFFITLLISLTGSLNKFSGLIILSSVIFFLSLGLLFHSIWRVLGILSFFVIFYTFVLTDAFYSFNSINYSVLLFLSLITILIQIGILISSFYSNIDSTTKLSMSQFWKTVKRKALNEELKLTTFFLIYVIISFFFVYSVFSTSHFNSFLTKVADNYSDYFSYLRSSFNQNENFYKKLILGSYNESVGLSTNSNSLTNISLMLSILRFQGLLGFGAYVILYVYALLVSIKSIASVAKRKNMIFSIPLSFFIIWVILYSFMGYPGIFLVVVWWIILAILSILFLKKDVDQNNIQEVFLEKTHEKIEKRKIFLTLKAILVIMSIGATYFIVSEFYFL